MPPWGWENSENDDGISEELVILKVGDNSKSCRGDTDHFKGSNEAKSGDDELF